MQANLFDDSADPDQSIRHELHGSIIQEYPQAFNTEQADQILSTLIEVIPWQQESIRIAGKIIPVPRLQCWMGDRESQYGYSGIRLKPVPWSSEILHIRQRAEQLAEMKFNSVLINYYRDGNDSVAWHADDEAELGPEAVIASVSFGAERDFQLKPKNQAADVSLRKEMIKLVLRSGSVLVMGKGLQDHWVHQLPKVNNLKLPRVNLTFRKIL